MKSKHYALLSTTIIIVIWWVVAIIVDNSVKIPSPYETMQALITIMSSKLFVVQVLNTLKRTLIGFMIAFVSGLALGIISGQFQAVYYLLRPLILAQRSVPTMVVILLALIWLNREIAPILVGFIVIFPIIYSAVVTGIKDIDKKLIEMATIYHLSRRKKLRHLYLPSITSSLRGVAAAAISLNLKLSIAAEVLSQSGNAIGTELHMEKMVLNTAGVLAWAIVAIFLGWILESLVSINFVSLIRSYMARSSI